MPDVERLAQGRALGLDGEVDVHGGAAERRRLVAGEEIVRRDRAAEGHVQVRMYVDPAGDDILAARVDRRVAGQPAGRSRRSSRPRSAHRPGRYRWR